MEEKSGKIELTEEYRDLIFKGIRPKDLPYNIYKQVRKGMQERTKQYLKGVVAWEPNRWVKLSDEEIERREKEGEKFSEEDLIENQGKGTYIRKGPRRHETFTNRKWYRDNEKEKLL